MGIFRDEYDNVRDIWLLLCVPIGLLGIAIGIWWLFLVLDYVGTKSACAAYSNQTGRETKFIDDAPWWWSCQVKTSSGWIEYDKLQQIETPNINVKQEQ